jgi:hypothetical protein
MGFLDDIIGIKENKRVLLLLGGGALLLVIILLLPAGGEREIELPPGFERADGVLEPLEEPLLVEAAPMPMPVVAERVFLPPQLLKEARKRHARGWGTDPFLLVAAEAGYVRLHLEAIFLGARRQVIINGRVLTIGDKIGGYEITGISEGVVTLERNGLIRSLSFW